MTDVKISALTAIPALAGTDVLPIVDATDTTTKKVTIDQLDNRRGVTTQFPKVNASYPGRSVPGWSFVGQTSATGDGATTGYVHAIPVMVSSPVRLLGMSMLVQTASSVAAVCRHGIYQAVRTGVYWGGPLLADQSTVALGTTGLKSISLGSPFNLEPGELYMFTSWFEQNAATRYAAYACVPNGWSPPLAGYADVASNWRSYSGWNNYADGSAQAIAGLSDPFPTAGAAPIQTVGGGAGNTIGEYTWMWTYDWETTP